jgi:hypothetical protein
MQVRIVAECSIRPVITRSKYWLKTKRCYGWGSLLVDMMCIILRATDFSLAICYQYEECFSKPNPDLSSSIASGFIAGQY